MPTSWRNISKIFVSEAARPPRGGKVARAHLTGIWSFFDELGSEDNNIDTILGLLLEPLVMKTRIYEIKWFFSFFVIDELETESNIYCYTVVIDKDLAKNVEKFRCRVDLNSHDYLRNNVK